MPTPPPRAWLAALSLVAVLGAASVLEPRLSVFAVLLAIIALASTSRVGPPWRKRLRVLLGVALALACLGLGRFVVREAMPGIIEASERASGARAVSVLREILFAQDALRRNGLIDPDGDGIGGAGRLGELTASAGARGGAPLLTPPLAPYLRPQVPTPQGPAAREGDFLYLVCVPGRDGQLTAEPDHAVDEELAERRFVAYAWPAHASPQLQPVFFIDEHERILEADATAPSAGAPSYVGPAQAPRCDAALADVGQTQDGQRAPTSTQTPRFRPWRDKQPRAELPGLQRP